MPLRKTTASCVKAKEITEVPASVKRGLDDIVMLTGNKENAINTIKLKLKYAAEDNIPKVVIVAYETKLTELQG